MGQTRSIGRGLLACVLIGVSAVLSAPSADASVVAASVWPAKSYFVRNDAAIGKQPAFIVNDKATFEAIFGYAATMGSASPLDASIFSTKTMLGIAEQRSSICTSTLVSVTQTGREYTVRYTQTCPPPSSAQYLVPFVVVVPKAPIASVTFVKNGNFLAQIKRRK